VFLSDSHSFKNLGVNLFSFDINDIHFLSDALKSRLSTQCSHISTNKAMSILGYCLQIDILSKFHIFCVDSKNLKSTDLVRNSDVDLSIKTTKSSKSGINSIWPVSSGNNNNMSSTLQTVHKGKHL
jgi:hypothetical protein